MKETNKWISAIAYIIFFVPILVDSNNEEYKFHTNQGLNLFLFFVAITIIGTFLPVIGWFLILPLASVFSFVLCIMGIMNAINGKMKELPIMGKYKLIK